MEKHQWQEEEDGVDVLYRAEHFGGKWTFSSQPQTARRGEDKEPWDIHEPPTLEMLEKLRVLLWNKYQRKRLSWKMIEKLDKLIDKVKTGEE